MPKFIVTYTTDHAENLDDDFAIIQIHAHNQKEVDLIINNIERMFKGVTIQCEESTQAKSKRKRVNSDKRIPKHR